jgi:hypothetical protein
MAGEGGGPIVVSAEMEVIEGVAVMLDSSTL